MFVVIKQRLDYFILLEKHFHLYNAYGKTQTSLLFLSREPDLLIHTDTLTHSYRINPRNSNLERESNSYGVLNSSSPDTLFHLPPSFHVPESGHNLPWKTLVLIDFRSP